MRDRVLPLLTTEAKIFEPNPTVILEPDREKGPARERVSPSSLFFHSELKGDSCESPKRKAEGGRHRSLERSFPSARQGRRRVWRSCEFIWQSHNGRYPTAIFAHRVPRLVAGFTFVPEVHATCSFITT